MYTEKYQNLTKLIDFKDGKFLSRDDKRGTFLVLGKIKLKKVLLKVTAEKNLGRKKRFKKELSIDKLINEYNESASVAIKKADMITSGENKDFLWVVREYFNESLTVYGGAYEKTPLWGYDIIKKKFLSDTNKIVNDMVDNISAFRMVEKSKKAKSFPKRFPEELLEKNIRQIEKDFNLEISSQVSLYKNHKKNYFSDERASCCHGDFVPANILLNGTSSVISDMEWFCIDNKMIDISWLWLFLWRYPIWQRKIIESLVRSVSDQEDFRMSVIRQIINWQYLDRFIDLEQKNKRHIWIKYLENAGKSFEELIGTK